MKILKISKFIDDNTGILVRIDDVAENMNWPIMKKVEKILNEYNIKPVVGVIPNNHDENLLSFPKESNFWEIVYLGSTSLSDCKICLTLVGIPLGNGHEN